MSPGARVDSDSPRRLAASVRRLLGESESAAAAALTSVRSEVDGTQRELGARKGRLGVARRRLGEAEAALANCRRNRRANCAGLDRAVAVAKSELRRQEERTRIAEAALADLRRALERLVSAERRLRTRQRQEAEGAWRELAQASTGLAAYLAAAFPAGPGGGGRPAPAALGPASAGSPGAGGAGRRFSNAAVADSWTLGFGTPAGRAYFSTEDPGMRALASALKPFLGEYTVDVHGSSTSVSVGEAQLGPSDLAELVQADPDWGGRPVRLFSCETGSGAHPIAADLADELDVKVTAPKNLVWSNDRGESWVGSYEWKMVGGTMQRVPGPPEVDGWSTFDPGSGGKGAAG